MSAAAPPAQPLVPGNRWFFGPLPDLLFGCGLVYAVFFVWQTVDGDGMRGWLPQEILPLLILVLGAPHYGATLLRVYARPEDRRRYALFGVGVTALLAALYVAGLRWTAVGSLLITLYFTWNPWHYAGQNYGLAVLFLRRRGVVFDRTTKRMLYGVFFLSFLLVFLYLHTAGPVVQQAPATLHGTVFEFWNLGIPRGVRSALAPVLLAGCLACAAGAAWRLRAAPWRDLAPTSLLAVLQILWFAAPMAASIWRFDGIDPLSPAQRPYAFLWIAVGHFAQYIWITTYYAAASERTAGRLRFMAKATLAGAAIWTIPALIFAPERLGQLPYDLGLGLLTAAVVNLHHFVLDGAIWKLRDGRVARMLLRPKQAPGETLSGPALSVAGRGLRVAAWGAGGLVMLAALGAQYERFIGDRAARRSDTERMELAVERLARLGQDSPNPHIRLAQRALRAGDLAQARRRLDRARAIYPTPAVWTTYASAYEQGQQWPQALDAYDRALALEPDNAAALVGSARVMRRMGDLEGALERAERAARLRPGDRRVQILVDGLRKRTDRPEG